MVDVVRLLNSQLPVSIKKNLSNITIRKVPLAQPKPQDNRKGSIVQELSKYPNIELSKVKRREDNQDDDDIQEILQVSHPKQKKAIVPCLKSRMICLIVKHAYIMLHMIS